LQNNNVIKSYDYCNELTVLVQPTLRSLSKSDGFILDMVLASMNWSMVVLWYH